jgi:hypothetical protein
LCGFAASFKLIRIAMSSTAKSVARRLAAAVLALGCCSPESHALEIFRPKIGVPEFAEPGGSFRVEVTAAAGLAGNGWSATLFNDLRSWTNLVVQSAAYGTRVYNNTSAGYLLTIQPPPDAPPELFSLTVRHAAGGAATNRHAVSLLPRLETDFYIVHYADPQTSASNALAASGMNSPYGSIQEIYWHAPVLSLINPRFLFNTGDELDNGDVDTVNRYRQYLDAIETLRVPLLITRGNNDRGDFGHWKSVIGQAAYSLTLGSFYVCMNDTRGNEMFDWFANEYAASFNNTNIRYRLFGQHFNANPDGRNPYFHTPPAGREPHLMLVGHSHSFSVLQTSPYPVLSSGPAHYYGASGLFAFYTNGTQWLCPGATNHPAGTQFLAVGDWGAPNVACAYGLPNNGSSPSNTALISNSLAFDFWDGRVRFHMPHARGGYAVSGGVKLAEYDYSNGTNTAVLVRVNIRSNRVSTVSIARADSDDDRMPDAWELAEFGDLTTATSDSDRDGDACLDAQEYIAGTQPTNAASFFRLLGDGMSGSGPVLRWPSVSNRFYAVAKASNLLDGIAGFKLLTNASRLPATPAANTFTDDLCTAEGAYYRIGVLDPAAD